MVQNSSEKTRSPVALPEEWRESVNTKLTDISTDWSSDQDAFKNVHWGKAMMWIFLVSDTFIFTCFFDGIYDCQDVDHGSLAGSQRGVWRLTIAGHHIPLILIAIMTFILITQQWHDGDGCQLWLPRRTTQNSTVNVCNRLVRCIICWYASL